MGNPLSLKNSLRVLIAAVLLAIACAPRPGPPVAKLRAGTAEAPLVFASSSSVPVEWNLLRQVDPPATSPYLFVHLHDDSSDPIRTFDREIPGDSAEVDHVEIWQSALADPLPAGSYKLTVGFYDVATGQRWRLDTNGTEINDGEYEVATIEVESVERKTPELVFEGDWLTPEEGLTHNPGRRWLGEGGSIRLAGNTGWSEMVLSLSMTALPADQHRLVLEKDASGPELVIRNGCDSGPEASGSEDEMNGSEIRIDGYGVHSVILRLGAGDDCAISLKPNFTMLGLEDFIRRSVGLESAFFRPISPNGG